MNDMWISDPKVAEDGIDYCIPKARFNSTFCPSYHNAPPGETVPNVSHQ